MLSEAFGKETFFSVILLIPPEYYVSPFLFFIVPFSLYPAMMFSLSQNVPKIDSLVEQEHVFDDNKTFRCGNFVFFIFSRFWLDVQVYIIPGFCLFFQGVWVSRGA